MPKGSHNKKWFLLKTAPNKQKLLTIRLRSDTTNHEPTKMKNRVKKVERDWTTKSSRNATKLQTITWKWKTESKRTKIMANKTKIFHFQRQIACQHVGILSMHFCNQKRDRMHGEEGGNEVWPFFFYPTIHPFDPVCFGGAPKRTAMWRILVFVILLFMFWTGLWPGGNVLALKRWRTHCHV